MGAPLFVQASAGATDSQGAWTAYGPTTCTVGNVIIFQLLQDGNTVGAVTYTQFNSLKNLLGSGSEMTLIGSFPGGAGDEFIQHIFIGRVTNATNVFITGNNSTSEDLYWRFYEFTDVSTGTTLATVIENGTAGSAASSGDTTNAVTPPDIESLGPDRMALAFIGVNDDNAIARITGMTGGAWIVTVNPYADSAGTDGAIGIQHAYIGPQNPYGVASFGIGTGSNQQRRAQSFKAVGNATSVGLKLVKVNNPTDNLDISIQTDSAGVPSGTSLGSTSIAASSIQGSPAQWYDISLSATLTPGTTYWIVAERSGSYDASNYIAWAYSVTDVYADGEAAVYNAGWTTYSYDCVFSVRPNAGTVSGGSGSITDSDPWAVVGFALIGTTVESQTKDVVLGLLDSSPALYAPTVQPDQFLTIPLLDGSPALYAPTVVPAPRLLTIPLLDAAPALYAPTVVPGPVGVTLGLLDGAPALYQPTLTPKWLISPALLDGAPALYAPTIVPGPAQLTLALIDAGTALYAPTLLPGPVLASLPLLDGVPATYAPAILPIWQITVGLIDAGPALYAPAVIPAQFVVVPLLDAAPDLYQPTVAKVGGATQDLTIPLLDGEPATYAPALAVGPVTLTLGLIDAGPATYAPALMPAQFITLGLIDGGADTYAPTLLPQPLGVGIPLLDGAPALYPPTLLPGPVGITIGLIDGVPALYAPTLVPAPLGLFLSLLDGGTALYDPTLTQTGGALQSLSLPALDAAPAVYPPSIGFTLALPALDSGPALYQPALLPLTRLGPLATLDSGPALYPPALQPTWTVGPLVVIGAGPVLYPPVLAAGAITIGPLGLIDAGPMLYELTLFATGERSRYRGRIGPPAAARAAIAPAGRRGTLQSSEPVGDVE